MDVKRKGKQFLPVSRQPLFPRASLSLMQIGGKRDLVGHKSCHFPTIIPKWLSPAWRELPSPLRPFPTPLHLFIHPILDQATPLFKTVQSWRGLHVPSFSYTPGTSATFWDQCLYMSVSLFLSLFICLCVRWHISKPHVQISPHFLYMLPVTTARSCRAYVSSSS